MAPSLEEPDASGPYAAVVVDQYELFRLGIKCVLDELDVHVAGSTQRAGEALRIARDESVDLLIVGKTADLKAERVLHDAKRLQKPLRVLFLLDRAQAEDVARLLSLKADGLLLRTVGVTELQDALDRMFENERVVAPALASGTLGRIGPAMDVPEEERSSRSGLSPKELEVLAVLSEGATYKEIAEALIVTQATVKTHLVHIYKKLEVKNREHAVARALALGLLS